MATGERLTDEELAAAKAFALTRKGEFVLSLNVPIQLKEGSPLSQLRFRPMTGEDMRDFGTDGVSWGTLLDVAKKLSIDPSIAIGKTAPVDAGRVVALMSFFATS